MYMRAYVEGAVKIDTEMYERQRIRVKMTSLVMNLSFVEM